METLYDLLGALPHDNAEDLRAAFRRAVKGAHPDMRPGDPDAALKFREIVRASEILGDAEQRSVYDNLLQLAHLEQKPVRPLAASIRKTASTVIALGWISVATMGGYLLFTYMSAAPIASMIGSETMAAFPPASGRTDVTGEPMAPPAALPVDFREDAPASNASAASGLTASEDRSMPFEGFPACINSDLKIRFADLDDALQRDTKALPAYVDPGVIFYRKSDAAFPDIAGAKRTETAGRSKPAPTMSRKRQVVAAAIATPVMPLSQRRMTAQDSSRGETFAQAVRWR
jgi:curved DNA-binding protein CbpA